MNRRCLLCKKLLDVPGDPTSLDCGGDCAGCMAEIEGRTLYVCQKCGEEFGEGEQDRGRCPHCGGEGAPNGVCPE